MANLSLIYCTVAGCLHSYPRHDSLYVSRLSQLVQRAKRNREKIGIIPRGVGYELFPSSRGAFKARYIFHIFRVYTENATPPPVQSAAAKRSLEDDDDGTRKTQQLAVVTVDSRWICGRSFVSFASSSSTRSCTFIIISQQQHR